MGADAGPLLFPIQTTARRLFGSALAFLGFFSGRAILGVEFLIQLQADALLAKQILCVRLSFELGSS